MENPFETEKQKKRPNLLTVLCILTFIGSGISLFSYLLCTISYDNLLEYDYESMFGSSYEQIQPLIERLLGAGVMFFVLLSLLFAASLLGAIFMWNLKSFGFHIYTIAQILILMMPMAFNAGDFSLASTILTSLFILLYGLNLKYMKKKEIVS